MIDLTNIQKIYLIPEPIDFRLGLSALAARSLEILKTNKIQVNTLFLYINKKHNYIKAIEFDNTGIWLYSKRLNETKFPYPSPNGNVYIINKDNLRTILQGLDFIVKIDDKTKDEITLY